MLVHYFRHDLAVAVIENDLKTSGRNRVKGREGRHREIATASAAPLIPILTNQERVSHEFQRDA